MSRDWKKFENDEIIAMWQTYKSNEFPGDFHISEFKHRFRAKSFRLTPFEIIELVDELVDRLNKKDEVSDV